MLTVGATNIVAVDGIRDQLAAEWPAHADITATVTLYTADGATVDDAVDLPCTYRDGEGRRQRLIATIPHTVELVSGTEYQVHVTLTVATEDGDVVGVAKREETAI